MAGQGLCRLPGSALSLPGELPRALRGEAAGGRSPPGRAGSCCWWEAAAWGSLLTDPQHTHRAFHLLFIYLFHEDSQVRNFLLPFLFPALAGLGEGAERNGKGTVKFKHISKIPELFL